MKELYYDGRPTKYHDLKVWWKEFLEKRSEKNIIKNLDIRLH